MDNILSDLKIKNVVVKTVRTFTLKSLYDVKGGRVHESIHIWIYSIKKSKGSISFHKTSEETY